MANESEFLVAKWTYLVTFLLGVTINLMLILKIIFTKPARRGNKTSHTIFMVHFALISICLAFDLLVNTSEFYFLTPVPPGLCQPVAYMKNVLLCAYSVNTVVVIRDRMQLVRLNKDNCYWTARVVFIWAVSLLFSVPTAFLIESSGTNSDRKCVMVNLFGRFAATATYEVMKYVLFYLLVTLDIIRITRNFGRKVNNLDAKNRRQAHRMRMLHFFLIMFSIYWLSKGFYSGYRKLILRYGSGFSEESSDYQQRWSSFSVYFELFLHFCLLLVPLLSYLLFESKPKLTPSQLCTCKWHITSVSTISQDSQQSLDRHGFTTCQHSITSQHLESEKREQIEICYTTKTVRWNIASPKIKVGLSESEIQPTSMNASTRSVNEIKSSFKEWLI